MANDTRTVALQLQKDFENAKSVAELDALIPKYYGENVRQQEAGKEWKQGLKAVQAAESGFFNYLEHGKVDKHEVHSIAVDGNKAFLEVTTTFTLKGNPTPIAMHQLVEQEWKGRKLVLERFWHHKA